MDQKAAYSFERISKEAAALTLEIPTERFSVGECWKMCWTLSGSRSMRSLLIGRCVVTKFRPLQDGPVAVVAIPVGFEIHVEIRVKSRFGCLFLTLETGLLNVVGAEICLMPLHCQRSMKSYQTCLGHALDLTLNPSLTGLANPLRQTMEMAGRLQRLTAESNCTAFDCEQQRRMSGVESDQMGCDHKRVDLGNECG